jgi:hypothetical protein
MIWMQHDHDLGAFLESLQITGFLVSPVSPVLHMNNGLEPQGARNLHGLVLAHVID